MRPAHPPIRLLRNVATNKFVRALDQDGFEFIERQGSQRVYHHRDGRFVDYHRAGDTLPPHVIRNLLKGTRRSEADLRRLKLIK
jgi:predicted RNA binding protein YcfA (HicA-like mRNA interferase family)